MSARRNSNGPPLKEIWHSTRLLPKAQNTSSQAAGWVASCNLPPATRIIRSKPWTHAKSYDYGNLQRAPNDPRRLDSENSGLGTCIPDASGLDSQRESLRQAEILYSQGEYRDASEILKTLCKEYPENSQAKKDLTKTIFRLLEQQRGGYNFKSLYAEVEKLRPPRLDRATYFEPVEVRNSQLTGRGLFTKSAVKAGDLLVCEKAFSYCYIDSLAGTEAALREATLRKLGENPGSLSALSSVYHGSYVPKLEVDGQPFVDPQLVDKILTTNSLGGSLTSLSSHLAASTLTPTASSGHSSGLWILAATINHSCFSNCRRSFIGDMLIIRASQDLPADTELLWAYRNPAAKDHEYDATQKSLSEYEFICACELCTDAKATGKKMLKKREALRAELSAAFGAGSVRGGFDCGKVDMGRLEKTLGLLEKTYSSSAIEVPRTGIWDPYLALTRMYAILGRPQNVIWSVLKVLENLGFAIEGASFPPARADSVIAVVKWGLVVDHLVECWVLLWTAYAVLRDVRRAEMAREMAVVSYRVLVGEDETFEETYGVRARGCVAQGRLWSSS
ncbi:uncharacterized protein L3040_004807 [Drepanopeziza brunnea f. sp. 'multigermtubi']|uniref:uncharacterized protein n=1 Tax=Drepanopeziza brunnea f. sp. 'multigermtubi' TaxID=698441 RepID=UPI0023A74723|nr:hypothetical protein L3040_004807 [Drepanopeziza brunnea f. sp. 'multigermtubi']